MPSAFWYDKLARDELSGAVLLLLTVSHPSMESPLRFVRDQLPVVSRGHGYVPFPFRFQRPGHGEDGPIGARCVVDNVSQDMAKLLLSLPSSPTLVFELVLESDPDTVEEPFPPFKMTVISGNRFEISAPLMAEDDGSQEAMQWTFGPKLAPALFN